MKKLLPIITLLLLFFQLNAQTTKLDSLQNILTTQEGEEKVKTLAEISKCYYSSKPDSGLFYIEIALDLIEKEKLEELYVQCFLIKGVCYSYKSEQSESFKCYNEALIWGEKFENKEQLGKVYNAIGTYYQVINEYDSALIAFDKAIENHKLSGKKEFLGKVYDNIGIIHFLRGEFNSALENFLLAKSYFEENKDEESLAASYFKIASIYSELKNYSEAEKYALLSYTLLKETTDYLDIVRSLINLGIISRGQKKYEQALTYYNEALKILENQPIKYVESSIYGNIGTVYFYMENYQKSKEYHLLSLKISEEISDDNTIASGSFNLGEIEFILKNYTEAEKYFLKAISKYEKNNEVSRILKCYNRIYETYKAQNKISLSLEYLEKYSFLNDSILKTEKGKSLDSLLTVFHTKEIETENVILTKETEIKSKTIENQRLYIISALVIITLIVLLTLIILKNRNKLKIAYNIVNQKNSEISQYAEELKATNEKLLEMDKFKAGLMQMIVHDLKNPLSNLLNIGIIKSQEEQIKIVTRTSKQILNQTYNILDVYKYEDVKMNLKQSKIFVNELINNAVEEVNHLLKSKNIASEKDISENISVNCDIEIITRVLVNLLTNAIKYSELNSKIEIRVTKNGTFAEFSVLNYGTTIPKEYHEKIFDKFVQLEAKDSGKVQSTGLGLAFCKLALENHNNKIYVDSTFEKGTKFVFNLPIVAELEKQNAAIEKSELNNLLSEEEIKLLSQYYITFSETQLYKTSKIKNVIEQIKEQNQSNNINKWCEDIYNSALNNNQQKYFQLIDIIK